MLKKNRSNKIKGTISVMYSYWSFGKLQICITNEIYIHIDYSFEQISLVTWSLL